MGISEACIHIQERGRVDRREFVTQYEGLQREGWIRINKNADNNRELRKESGVFFMEETEIIVGKNRLNHGKDKNKGETRQLKNEEKKSIVKGRKQERRKEPTNRKPICKERNHP